MSDRIRVFLVDDSAAVRSILSQILEEDPLIDVVGSAPDGSRGLELVQQLKPDILVLDIEMPGMGGLEMLEQLKVAKSTMPVIVFSSMTERGAMVTIEALSRGASDYVTKPAMVGSANAARDYIRTTLLEKIHCLTGRRRDKPQKVTPKPAPVLRRAENTPVPIDVARSERTQVDAVVMGISMGGPEALRRVIPKLPMNFPVPFLIVQHMPALFTRALAQSLTACGGMPVYECAERVRLEPGCVWLAPGDFHLRVGRTPEGVFAWPEQGEPVNFCRPAADVLFSSAAQAYGRHLLAVVMTGMGHDGLDGARDIRAQGGDVIVQDEKTSVVWGMAGRVAEAGLATRQIPLADIPAAIVSRVAVGRRSALSEKATR